MHLGLICDTFICAFDVDSYREKRTSTSINVQIQKRCCFAVKTVLACSVNHGKQIMKVGIGYCNNSNSFHSGKSVASEAISNGAVDRPDLVIAFLPWEHGS